MADVGRDAARSRIFAEENGLLSLEGLREEVLLERATARGRRHGRAVEFALCASMRLQTELSRNRLRSCAVWLNGT
jgi:hypothetical protein